MTRDGNYFAYQFNSVLERGLESSSGGIQGSTLSDMVFDDELSNEMMRQKMPSGSGLVILVITAVVSFNTAGDRNRSPATVTTTRTHKIVAIESATTNFLRGSVRLSRDRCATGDAGGVCSFGLPSNSSAASLINKFYG